MQLAGTQRQWARALHSSGVERQREKMLWDDFVRCSVCGSIQLPKITIRLNTFNIFKPMRLKQKDAI